MTIRRQPKRARKTMCYEVPDDAGGIRIGVRTVNGYGTDSRIDVGGGPISMLNQDGVWEKKQIERGIYVYDVTAANLEELVASVNGKLFKNEAAAIKEAEKRIAADAWMHQPPQPRNKG